MLLLRFKYFAFLDLNKQVKHLDHVLSYIQSQHHYTSCPGYNSFVFSTCTQYHLCSGSHNLKLINTFNVSYISLSLPGGGLFKTNSVSETSTVVG